MIVLLAGASHTGKTLAAQKLLEKYHYPYFSLDHLKMGLIRSGMTELTVADDEAMTVYLWPIVKEMIKTAIENQQNLVIEGSYIPFDWKESFTIEEQQVIRYICLIMSDDYIHSHFSKIKEFACAIEQRVDDSYCTVETLLSDNRNSLEQCQRFACQYLLIDGEYEVEVNLD